MGHAQTNTASSFDVYHSSHEHSHAENSNPILNFDHSDMTVIFDKLFLFLFFLFVVTLSFVFFCVKKIIYLSCQNFESIFTLPKKLLFLIFKYRSPPKFC